MPTQPTPNSNLVKVFDTEQETEAMVVKGLLESSGIDALISSLDAQQEVLPGVGGVIVQVAADRGDEAKEIIESYRNTGVDDAEVLSPEEGPESL